MRHFLQFYQKSLQAKIKIENHAKNKKSQPMDENPSVKHIFDVASGRSDVCIFEF